MGLKEFYTATGAKIFGTASTVKAIGAAAAASAVIAGAAAGVHAFTSGRDFTPDGAGRAIRTNQVHFDGSENTIGRQDEQTKNGESEIYERDESAEEKQKPQTGDSASYLFENVKQQEKPSGLLDRDGMAAAIAGTVPAAGAASVPAGDGARHCERPCGGGHRAASEQRSAGNAPDRRRHGKQRRK
ncbi:MAG: hypothetical protein ACLR4Z_01025 [Butyricicoccaceae bacterium]